MKGDEGDEFPRKRDSDEGKDSRVGSGIGHWEEIWLLMSFREVLVGEFLAIDRLATGALDWKSMSVSCGRGRNRNAPSLAWLPAMTNAESHLHCHGWNHLLEAWSWGSHDGTWSPCIRTLSRQCKGRGSSRPFSGRRDRRGGSWFGLFVLQQKV